MVRVLAGLMGGSVASGSTSMTGPEKLRPFLTMLKRYGVDELDTARVYNSGQSERDVGEIPEARKDFSIHTKAPGFSPGSLSYHNVLDNCNASLAALKQDKIDLYYFHGPDRSTPLEDSCSAINQLHQEGKIGAFGVSNYNAGEVEKIHSICKSNSWITPTVYQGGYNGLARGGETGLFPVLRRLGMAFYAFSPLAGGYFSKTTDALKTPASGSRMDQMKHFKSMYVNDTSLAAHDRLQELCGKESITMKEAALRWLMHHSILGENDGVILGASSLEQMEDNLKAVKGGPLPSEIAGYFEEMWSDWKKAGLSTAYSI